MLKCSENLNHAKFKFLFILLSLQIKNCAHSSTAFKIDAILNSQNDLELVKKQNRDLAQEFTLQSNLEKINSIIGNV